MRIGGLEGLGEIFQFTAEAGRTGSCAERGLINFVYRLGQGGGLVLLKGGCRLCLWQSRRIRPAFTSQVKLPGCFMVNVSRQIIY